MSFKLTIFLANNAQNKNAVGHRDGVFVCAVCFGLGGVQVGQLHDVMIDDHAVETTLMQFTRLRVIAFGR